MTQGHVLSLDMFSLYGNGRSRGYECIGINNIRYVDDTGLIGDSKR